MPKILDDEPAVVPFVTAMLTHPEAGIIVYNRVSSWSQAGKGKVKLKAKTQAVVEEVGLLIEAVIRLRTSEGEMSSCRLQFTAEGVEEGKLSAKRPTLLRAAEYAERHGGSGPMILVASDLSRLIRSEAYDRRMNPEAQPTPEEFARVREMTGGMVLATLEDSPLTETELHRKAMKGASRCGRPSEVDPALAERIFEELGSWRPFCWRFEESIASVARRCGVTKSKVQRLIESAVPEWYRLLKELPPGFRWKDFQNPASVYRKYRKLEEYRKERGGK
jgi:hypothetical protein